MEAYYQEKNVALIKDILGKIMLRMKIFFLKLCLFLVPIENVATLESSAVVSEGVSRIRNALINGDYQSYDWDTG